MKSRRAVVGKALSFLVGGLLLVCFQNCGQFQANTGQAVDSSSVKADDQLKIETVGSSGKVLKGQVFRVRANLAAFPDAQGFLWDHEFGNGATYCEQTTALDKSYTDFVCPDLGNIKIIFVIFNHDGSENVKIMDLTVVDPDSTQPTPTPPPVIEKTGAELYQQHCAGCHQALSMSTKKNINLTRLNTGINSVSQMSHLKTALSDSDKQKIVSALAQ